MATKSISARTWALLLSAATLLVTTVVAALSWLAADGPALLYFGVGLSAVVLLVLQAWSDQRSGTS